MTLPPEIHRRTEADDVIWELPARPQLRGMGRALLLIGGLLPIAVLTIGIGVLEGGDRVGENWLRIVGLVLLFGLPDLPVVALGCLFGFGCTRIEWRRTGLVRREVVGPFTWSRRIPPEPPERIEVPRGRMRVNGRPVANGPGAEMAALILRYAGGRKRVLAWGYPARWLESLAAELRECFGRGADTPPLVVKTNVSRDGTPADDEAVEEQPPGSTVRVEQRGDRLQLVIPPVGVRKGSKGLFFFAVIWCGFTVVFTTLFRGAEKQLKGEVGGIFLLLALFLAVGVGMLLIALNMGRRRAVILADAQSLRIAREGLFGKRSWRWRWEEIADLRVGPSGMEIDGVPVLELQIHSRDGGKTGLFSERDDAELRWLTTLLRRHHAARGG